MSNKNQIWLATERFREPIYLRGRGGRGRFFEKMNAQIFAFSLVCTKVSFSHYHPNWLPAGGIWKKNWIWRKNWKLIVIGGVCIKCIQIQTLGMQNLLNDSTNMTISNEKQSALTRISSDTFFNLCWWNLITPFYNCVIL